MNKAETIRKAQDNWERKPSDYYPTPYNVTWALVDWLLKEGIFPAVCKRPWRVLEPCCGEGHISRVLVEEYSMEVTSHDINHTGYGEGGVDYLIKPEKSPKRYEFDAVITNPPFSLADRFIYRALRDAPVVAMLLPSDFWHARSRLRFFYSRPPRAILALTWRPAFLKSERGNNPIANLAWTVWDNRFDQTVGSTKYVPVDKP